jgi:antitoxin component of MazEF toxin-antitoxin module
MEAKVKIKQWGKGLGVRLTARVACAVGFTAETLVTVTVEMTASSLRQLPCRT